MLRGWIKLLKNTQDNTTVVFCLTVCAAFRAVLKRAPRELVKTKRPHGIYIFGAKRPSWCMAKTTFRCEKKWKCATHSQITWLSSSMPCRTTFRTLSFWNASIAGAQCKWRPLCTRSVFVRGWAVWDPSTKGRNETLEKVLCRCARFVTANYKSRESVTSTKRTLWPRPLSESRKRHRRKLFIFYNLLQ